MPEIMPVRLPAAAIAGLLLLHMPPVTLLCNVDILPMQALVVPVIGPGSGFTVMFAVARQPDESV